MANIMNITGKMFKIDYIILPFYSSFVTLQYSAVSVVSSAHCLASSVMSLTTEDNESLLHTYICYVCRSCGKICMVSSYDT